MNASGNLNPRNDRERWNPSSRFAPAVNGEYEVYNAAIGDFRAEWKDGEWWSVSGDKLGSVVKWWR